MIQHEKEIKMLNLQDLESRSRLLKQKYTF